MKLLKDARLVDKHYQNKSLYIDYCSHKVAVYSVLRWHYSRRMPKSKLVRFGVWEFGKFKGAIIYGLGANPKSGAFLGISNFECPELVRVALDNHDNAVSKIVSFTLKKIKKDFPNIKAIVSYADPEKNHKGGIYQAMNWTYIGKTSSSKIYIENGKEIHSKTISDRIRFKKLDKNHNLEYKVVKGKYKYVYLFDKSFADKLNKLKKPYP